MNLLTETLKVLEENGKSPKDVLWVGFPDSLDSYESAKFLPDDAKYGTKINPEIGTWDDFKKLADRQYDDGYGGAEVNEKLLIVGSDWWLERHEYDGSEWWEFKTLPKKPDGAGPLCSVLPIKN